MRYISVWFLCECLQLTGFVPINLSMIYNPNSGWNCYKMYWNEYESFKTGCNMMPEEFHLIFIADNKPLTKVINSCAYD